MMNGATFRTYREFLGLSQDDMAIKLGYKSGKTVQRWENETREIPFVVDEAMNQFLYYRVKEIRKTVKELEKMCKNVCDSENPVLDLFVYRSAENMPECWDETFGEHRAKMTQIYIDLLVRGFNVSMKYKGKNR